MIAAVLHELWLASLFTGQLLYVVAATVLLFYGADRLLALALVPGALMSAAYLAQLPVPTVGRRGGRRGDGGGGLRGGLVSRSPRSCRPVADRPAGPVRRSGLRTVVLQGLLSGIAVAYIPVRMLDGSRGRGRALAGPVHRPVGAEHGLRRDRTAALRAAGGRLMRGTVHLADYQRGASRLVVLCQLRFLLVLASVSGLVGVLINMTSSFNTRDLTLLCAYSILGPALLAALVLVAVDRVHVALLGFLLAGCAIAVGVGVLQATGLPMSVEGGYLAGCLILVSALTALAVRTLRDPRALA